MDGSVNWVVRDWYWVVDRTAEQVPKVTAVPTTAPTVPVWIKIVWIFLHCADDGTGWQGIDDLGGGVDAGHFRQPTNTNGKNWSIRFCGSNNNKKIAKNKWTMGTTQCLDVGWPLVGFLFLGLWCLGVCFGRRLLLAFLLRSQLS